MSKIFKWESAVRSYEIDHLGIVNNAVYLNYFDHTRVLHLQSLGLDWFQLHGQGYDFVLASTHLTYKISLKGFDEFYITSALSMSGKVTVVCHQELYLKNNQQLVTSAESKLTCIEIATGKLCIPQQLIKTLNE